MAIGLRPRDNPPVVGSAGIRADRGCRAASAQLGWARASRLLASVVATFAAAAVSACLPEPVYDGLACSDQEPCPPPLVCGTTGRCLRPCTASGDCPLDDQSCASGFCTHADEPVLCGRDSDCPVPGQSCNFGVCGEAGEECGGPGDCRTPGLCQMGEGATCVAGRCVYRPLPCNDPPPSECSEEDTVFHTWASVGRCSASTGACAYTPVELSCASCRTACLEPCEEVVCEDLRGGCWRDGHCVVEAPGAPAGCAYLEAEDGSACQLGAERGQGVCRGGLCVGCLVDDHCDDRSPCTRDVCDAATGTCRHEPVAGSCDDGSACTSGDTCVNGVCVGMSAVSCQSPPGECWEPIGTCEPATGACRYTPKAPGVACGEDGNACTDDVCDGAGSCAHPSRPDGASCDDGNPCTQVDRCRSGGCVGESPIACDRPPGTCFGFGTCNPANGQCSYPPRPAGTSCDDGELCTYGDTCDGSGACRGTSITCTNSPGTCGARRSCNGTASCSVVFPGSSVSCSDGNACTRSDACDGAGACRGTAYTCNDNNACTSDTCNGTGGCTFTRIAPSGLSPSGGQTLSTQSVTLTWTACSDAMRYEVPIEYQAADGTWRPYHTYTETVASRTFFPCSSQAPAPPCNSNFRFRVRAFNGTWGPWSGYAVWRWANCRAC